ncbi:ribonuclease H-like domain-containing protein [Tanacetum coccineum]
MKNSTGTKEYDAELRFGVESSSSENSDNSFGNTNSTESLYPNFQNTKGFHVVPPPTATVIPPRANVSFTGIDELAIRNKVNSDDEETDLNFSEIQKKTVVNLENSETSFENSPAHLIKDCNLHERTFKQTQTYKPKGTQGSRDTRPVWNNINRVNHSNFSGNSRYPHQKKSYIPSAVLTREGLKSTARPKMTQTVSSKSTANVFCQGTARPRVPHAVLSQSTGRPYYPRMDNVRPRTSSFSPSTRSCITRTPNRPQRPKKIMKSIWVKKESTVGSPAVPSQNVSVKGSAMINQIWRPKGGYLDSVNRNNGSYTLKQFEYGNPEEDLKDYAIIDSGCSGSMTGDKDKLSDFKEFKGGYVAFGNDSKGGRISGKGTIKTSCIDFEKVNYVEELKFNLLSVSQICDKKHNVLFTDKECLILSPKFKFVDEDLATKDEAVLWHRRLGHVNFKNINKLVKGNLVRGLPSKTFKLDHSCLACRKDSEDDVPKDGVFFTNSFDDENTDNEEDGAADNNNLDHTIDVSSNYLHIEFIRIISESDYLLKELHVLTRRKLKESVLSYQHHALLSFITSKIELTTKISIHAFLRCFLSQEKPKKVFFFTQLSEMKVRLKRCKKNCFNSSYNEY